MMSLLLPNPPPPKIAAFYNSSHRHGDTTIIKGLRGLNRCYSGRQLRFAGEKRVEGLTPFFWGEGGAKTPFLKLAVEYRGRQLRFTCAKLVERTGGGPIS